MSIELEEKFFNDTYFVDFPWIIQLTNLIKKIKYKRKKILKIKYKKIIKYNNRNRKDIKFFIGLIGRKRKNKKLKRKKK